MPQNSINNPLRLCEAPREGGWGGATYSNAHAQSCSSCLAWSSPVSPTDPADPIQRSSHHVSQTDKCLHNTR